jgi:predicted RNA-binding Zn ribbon-like protein
MPFRCSGSGRLRARELVVEAQELRWPLDSGKVSLDLVATVGERWGRRFERLRSPDDLNRWLRDAGLADAPDATEEDLEAVRGLRAAVYGAVEAASDQRPLPTWAREALNRSARVPTRIPQVHRNGRPWYDDGGAVRAAFSEVARDAIDLIASADLWRVRECAADDCARIFLDQSRPGTRRWCSMQTCGNRAKVRSHRARAGT